MFYQSTPLATDITSNNKLKWMQIPKNGREMSNGNPEILHTIFNITITQNTPKIGTYFLR